MAKYQNAYRDELDDKSYSEEIEETKEKEPQAKNPEEASFKKRYSDVRRHLSNVTSQKDREIATLKEQLTQATKKQIKFPKTDEEITQWSSRYPEVAKIIDTIAQKRANEAIESQEKKLESLRTMETKIYKEKAEQELHTLHPDFQTIRMDQKFHDWVAMQPQNIQDSLYKNTSDALSASRAIDLYKADMNIKKRGRPSKDAAKNISVGTANAPANTEKPKFSESQISQMSDKEYEKNEESIMEAMKNGNFEYDVSGAAR